jgi:hypothetical protein
MRWNKRKKKQNIQYNKRSIQADLHNAKSKIEREHITDLLLQ